MSKLTYRRKLATPKSLFEPSKDIYRRIEKVITYSASAEDRLKAEIGEYIVTDSIDEQFEKLLTRMQMAMEAGGQNEVGVWVSGFYGSGKSSYTKYLGLALDDRVVVDGEPFLKHLQGRLLRPQTRALLANVARRFPATVIMLDLASEMVAGATMEEVSSVLYYKVLQWAGYSRNLKVAALERRLQKDGRYEEFTQKVQAELGTPWKDVQNDPLVTDSVVPGIAHEMYPALFKSPTAFTTETGDFVRFENERVQEMIDIVRKFSGRQYLLFIIDEVGQYVASRQNLILNLDGLAKNFKSIGDGKVWVVGTAQQTLTEDDPKATLNSPELYKLKDRFPIQIELESSDIKEICHRRVLGKSAEGEAVLGERFDKYGQALRHNTKLQDARYYDADFDKKTFVNLYPFLPAHFDILLLLLGQLAKSTGGVGLRSAIKVVQDILVEKAQGQVPGAEQPVDWLVTTVTLYDALEKDIRRAYPSIHKAAGNALIRSEGSPVQKEVAKTVAVLQVLGNLPVTAQNVSSLMHPEVTAPSRRDQVDAAIKALINDPHVPFGEKDGNLCFFSEKLNDIEQQRAHLPLRSTDTRRILHEVLASALKPAPATKLHNALVVTTGLKALAGSQAVSLAGEREIVQTAVQLANEADYEAAREQLVEESRQRSSLNTVYLVGHAPADLADRVNDIYRCQEIDKLHSSDPDREVKDYCRAQGSRATKLTGDLQHALLHGLAQGSFIFRAQVTAVNTLAPDVLEAGKKHLAGVAKQVFDRFAEAPVRAETVLAEKFLRAGNLRAITSTIDPLELVQVSGGTPRVRTDHKALVSLRDYLNHNGMAEGKRLTEHFTGPPFGWSPDTLRYLVAALLVAGEVKLKVGGREVTANGQQALDALRTNTAFKTVGVALRIIQTPPEVLARAAERLTDLTGDSVLPLEDEISKATTKHFPQLQHRFGPLAEKLDGLGLPGGDDLRALSGQIADMLLTDASDAPQRLGGEQSSLYDGLNWARQVDVALRQGLEPTVRELQQHRREIEALPASGIPGQLRLELGDELALVGQRLAQEAFFNHAADLNTALTTIKARTRDAAASMADAQRNRIKEAQQDLLRLPEWGELTQEEQAQTLSALDGLAITAGADLNGLRQLLNQEFVISSRLAELKRQVDQLGRQRRLQRLEAEKARAKITGQTRLTRTVTIPATLRSADQLEQLLKQLLQLKEELSLYSDIEVSLRIEE